VIVATPVAGRALAPAIARAPRPSAPIG